MRLTQKKIEETMVSIVGEEGLPLVKELGGKDNISEFTLAEKVHKDIKVVRKMLYLRYNHNLVSFTRKKDKEKGWYIYYWTLLPDSIRFSYVKKKKELLERLKHRLEEENRELFFVCPNNCVRLNFDQSMDFEFHCPECGGLISQDDNKEKLASLQKRVVELEKELEEMTSARKQKRKKVREHKKQIITKKKALVRKKAVVKKERENIGAAGKSAKKSRTMKKMPLKTATGKTRSVAKKNKR